MDGIIRVSRQMARKAYTCNACEWIDALLPYDLSDYEITLSDAKQIVLARRNKWQIVPGQEYIKQVSVDEDGRFYVWRAIPAIHDICRAYDIYDYG